MFVFYDTETTGTNLDFDQILQFAAILTDDQLNEVERFEIRCRCRPWVVPAPMALFVTGISPAQLTDQMTGSHYEMMTAVREKLEAWSPAIFLGYNTIQFDEPLLQRAFWQTLHPPYLTVTNGNARMDVLPLVRAASHLAPGILTYPTTARRKTGFKLDQLAPLNGYSHEQAHDALADVEATVHIARRIADSAPALWQTMVAAAPKAETSRRCSAEEPVLIAEYFGAPSLWWGMRTDRLGSQTSAALMARLDTDWSGLSKLDDDGLEKALKASPNPLRRIPLNKAPVVFSLEEAQTHWGRAPTSHESAQARLLSTDSELRGRLVGIEEGTAPVYPPGEHLEQKVHEGFASSADAARMNDFHRLDWPGRLDLVRTFEDARFRQIAQRLIFEAAPELFSQEEAGRFTAAISERLHSSHQDPGLWRTIAMARAEISHLPSNGAGSTLSTELAQFFDTLASTYTSVEA
ncbi:exodeoxyribonuclease I [Hyphomonas adhaerens MHS-3]|uniref:Exodeoxyribonuclease I n=1 Tax=Hyphomonas adhaerens MHS-3 TaxID=1280949 RepID=A0A069E1W5_9PROT|nr:exonuclease domain-containing protein [Hyphomonas adhaerens]KCZ83528.1 exodeoxyribonuclease I [Hyphomonas adhaerens MHS-3]